MPAEVTACPYSSPLSPPPRGHVLRATPHPFRPRCPSTLSSLSPHSSDPALRVTPLAPLALQALSAFGLPLRAASPSVFQGQGCSQQGYTLQGYTGQHVEAQSFPGPGLQGQGFPGPGYAEQGGQGVQSQSFPGPGLQGQAVSHQRFPAAAAVSATMLLDPQGALERALGGPWPH